MGLFPNTHQAQRSHSSYQASALPINLIKRSVTHSSPQALALSFVPLSAVPQNAFYSNYCQFHAWRVLWVVVAILLCFLLFVLQFVGCYQPFVAQIALFIFIYEVLWCYLNIISYICTLCACMRTYFKKQKIQQN